MVKIDPVQFGVLISKITALANGNEMYHNAVDDIHAIVKRCVIEEQTIFPSVSVLRELLVSLQKAYRTLTGLGLKESKDAIEEVRQKQPEKVAIFTKSDLYGKLNALNIEGLSREHDTVIYNFINKL